MAMAIGDKIGQIQMAARIKRTKQYVEKGRGLSPQQEKALMDAIRHIVNKGR